jgi:hypothetical protein
MRYVHKSEHIDKLLKLNEEIHNKKKNENSDDDDE